VSAVPNRLTNSGTKQAEVHRLRSSSCEPGQRRFLPRQASDLAAGGHGELRPVSRRAQCRSLSPPKPRGQLSGSAEQSSVSQWQWALLTTSLALAETLTLWPRTPGSKDLPARPWPAKLDDGWEDGTTSGGLPACCLHYWRYFTACALCLWNQSFMAVVVKKKKSFMAVGPVMNRLWPAVPVRCSRWLLCIHSCDKLLKRSALNRCHAALPVIFLDVYLYPLFFAALGGREISVRRMDRYSSFLEYFLSFEGRWIRIWQKSTLAGFRPLRKWEEILCATEDVEARPVWTRKEKKRMVNQMPAYRAAGSW
jgi:hypothetical protein